MRLLYAVGLAFVLLAAPAGAVTGGGPASEPYPWMVSLQVSESHICGGSLVAPDTVLTAAHCVDGESAEDLSVVLGRTTLSPPGGERIGVKSFEVDEAYANDPDGGHDIALVRLQRPSRLPTLPIVTLDQAALWAPGAPVRVIGWGTSSFAVGDVSNDLQEADIEMISDADCAASYGGILNYGFNPETMVCAGKQTVGVKDACQGDSGGPLVARTATGFVQVGAVSFGLFCGLPLFYGVYARIGAPELHGWLAKRLGDPGGSGPQVLAEPSEVRVGVSHARRREHGRVLRVRVRATAPVTALKLTVLRRGKVLGSARLPRLRRAATLRIRTGRFHGQRLHLRVTATDAGGARVTERRTVVPRG